MSKTYKQNVRKRLYDKYDGLCAYSGTPLEDDWQADHIEPIIRRGGVVVFPERNSVNNLVAVQGVINHYKGSLSLELFKKWYLGGLHKRLAKLPKNPKTEKSKKNKAYMLKIAGYFGITPENPFNGKLYFETLEEGL